MTDPNVVLSELTNDLVCCDLFHHATELFNSTLDFMTTNTQKIANRIDNASRTVDSLIKALRTRNKKQQELVDFLVITLCILIVFNMVLCSMVWEKNAAVKKNVVGMGAQQKRIKKVTFALTD